MKLTKAQSKRFDEKFELLEGWYKDEFHNTVWMGEMVKQHLADELSRQKKDLIKELEKMRAVATMDDMSENRWIEGKSRNETIDQAIKTINEK